MTNNGLSEENIELAEKFIVNNPCKKGYPCLSISDTAYAVICYQDIKDSLPTSYILFGSNAYGCTSYGFYKTKNNKIYIIEAYINNIVSYYDTENCDFLLSNDNVEEMITNN